MSARSAISSIDAGWNPRSANTSPATASICSSRTARGTSRVPARRFTGRATGRNLLARRFGRRQTAAVHPVAAASRREDARHLGVLVGDPDGPRVVALSTAAVLQDPTLARSFWGVDAATL